MIFVYTTCASLEEAKKIGRLIVEGRLASCVNIWPINSVFFWENEIKEGEEVAMIIKTSETKIYQLEELIAGNHSYRVPCIASLDVRRVNQAYKEWLVRYIG